MMPHEGHSTYTSSLIMTMTESNTSYTTQDATTDVLETTSNDDSARDGGSNNQKSFDILNSTHFNMIF